MGTGTRELVVFNLTFMLHGYVHFMTIHLFLLSVYIFRLKVFKNLNIYHKKCEKSSRLCNGEGGSSGREGRKKDVMVALAHIEEGSEPKIQRLP